jgi:hypothetical protein
MRSKLVTGGLKRELQTLAGSLEKKDVAKRGAATNQKAKTARRKGGAAAQFRRKAGQD